MMGGLSRHVLYGEIISDVIEDYAAEDNCGTVQYDSKESNDAFAGVYAD